MATKGTILASEQISFSVTAAAAMTDAQAVAADKAALSLSTPVTANITLPTSGTNGSTISWASNNTTVISTAGVVTRQATDTTVTLTATITKNAATDTKAFSIVVTATSAASYTAIPASANGTWSLAGTAIFTMNNGALTSAGYPSGINAYYDAGGNLYLGASGVYSAATGYTWNGTQFFFSGTAMTKS
jgi:hypothetical protein